MGGHHVSILCHSLSSAYHSQPQCGHRNGVVVCQGITGAGITPGLTMRCVAVGDRYWREWWQWRHFRPRPRTGSVILTMNSGPEHRTVQTLRHQVQQFGIDGR